MLAVRQTGVFTAVIQPPLLLFVSVPGAYFLFHGGTIGRPQGLLINCGYPLIERFPLMFFTSAACCCSDMAALVRGHAAPSRAPAEAGEPRVDESVVGGDGEDLRIAGA